jgi:cyclase
VRSIEDIRNLLLAGADKVCIGTAFFEKPNLVKEAASKFGSQAIVVSVDSDAGSVTVRCGSKDWGYLHGPTWTEPKAVATLAQTDGAGEILLQSVNRDGTMEGYDIDLIREVASALSVPLIVSGGCSGTTTWRVRLLQVPTRAPWGRCLLSAMRLHEGQRCT